VQFGAKINELCKKKIYAIDVGISRGINGTVMMKEELMKKGQRVWFDPVVPQKDIKKYTGGCAQLQVTAQVHNGKLTNVFKPIYCEKKESKPESKQVKKSRR
jgi:hypothetical protein